VQVACSGVCFAHLRVYRLTPRSPNFGDLIFVRLHAPDEFLANALAIDYLNSDIEQTV
jgi:hypothetical protein